VTVSKSISRPIVTPGDDESLVRLTVRRYLLSQGVQVVNCALTVTDDRATADCETVGHTTFEQPGRLFVLERANDGWAIKSIELK
jgi:hypothetical protein